MRQQPDPPRARPPLTRYEQVLVALMFGGSLWIHGQIAVRLLRWWLG